MELRSIIPHHILFYLILETDFIFIGMLDKILIAVLLVVFSAFFYLIFTDGNSIWRKIVNILLVIFLFCLCIFEYISDKNQAYYGNSIYEHHVLPFDLQVIKGWNHDLGCEVYNFGRFGDVFTETQQISIQNGPRTPNQYICMETILSYGYNKDEIIIHWLGCDSIEYYERVDSPEWCYISASQLIAKDDIKVEDYKWVSLVKVCM